MGGDISITNWMLRTSRVVGKDTLLGAEALEVRRKGIGHLHNQPDLCIIIAKRERQLGTSMRELKEKYCLGPDEQSPIPSTRIEVVVYQNGHEDLVACKNSDRRDGISYCSGTGVPCRYHEDPPTQ